MEKSILILTSYYYPETGAGANRVTSIAEFLSKKGWKVSVITQLPNYPHNAVFKGYDVKTPFRKKENRMDVIRLRPVFPPKQNLIVRFIAEAIFAIKVFFYSLRFKTSIVMVSTPYIALAPVGYFLAKLKRKPFVWDVRDLTWFYPKYIGKRLYLLDSLLDKVMRFFVAKANMIFTPVDGIFEYLKPFNSNCVLVPNGVSEAFLTLTDEFVDSLKFDGEPLILYVGLFGFMHGLDVLIEAAKELKEFKFLLIGDGPEKENLLLLSKGLENVKFLNYQPRENLVNYYKSASVLVSLVKAGEFAKIAQPSKVWEYMATGRPVVYCGEGELAKFLERNELAYTCPAGDPKALVSTLRKVANEPERAKKIARNARKFVEENRVREVILENLENHLLSLLK